MPRAINAELLSYLAVWGRSFSLDTILFNCIMKQKCVVSKLCIILFQSYTCLDVLGRSLMCIFWSSPYRIRSDQIFSLHLLHSATLLLKKWITNQSLVSNQTTQWLWLAGTTLHSQSTKEIWWKHQQTWTSSHWQSRWTYRWSQFE